MARLARPRSSTGTRKGPGAGVIWSRERLRKINKVAARNAWAMTITIQRDLAYDLDVRPLVAHVSEGLAKYYRDQVEKGERADGAGRLRPVRESTKAADPRVGDRLLQRSGYGAKHWWLGKLSGNAVSATRLVKPYGGSAGPEPSRASGLGRDGLLNVMLKWGVDFQSVRGEARKRAIELCAEWLSTTIGEHPGMAAPRSKSGTLPEIAGTG